MEHYVTLFDSLFLPQGIALHRSMERCMLSFTLWILCVDDAVFVTLTKLDLPNVRLLKLSELESKELVSVKSGRTKAEYCWTLTPFAPRFVFEADPLVHRVTYVDADIWFRRDPSPIFHEFDESGKHVLITDHAYAPEYDQSATSGQYCVQFMIFTREKSELVRGWWEDRCIEWCYRRLEDGKFGDQKYLDDWPLRFSAHVHVLSKYEWTLAPWNATRFPFSQGIFYHFHGVRLLRGHKIDFGAIYSLPETLIENLYKPYANDLIYSIKLLNIIGVNLIYQGGKLNVYHLFRRFMGGLYHQLWRFHYLNFRKY